MSHPEPPGAPNMAQLLAQAQKMQAGLMAAQAEMASARYEGSAGGGLVRATVSGAGELLGLVIDPDAVDPNDPETLADLVIAAVRDANTTAQREAAARLGPLAGALGGGAGGSGALGGLGDALGLPGLG